MDTTPQAPSGFASLGLAPVLVAPLTRNGITEPTPIQAGAIPVVLNGQDVIGIAQTGTGKTFAFALPILQQMLANSRHVLILVPTRELALQVEESIRLVTRSLAQPMRTVALIGGMPAYRQVKDLKMRPRIFVATPGRLVDFLDQRLVNLDQVGYLVLDEADRMFDMGFAPQVTKILAHLHGERQTLLFSATMSPEVVQLAATYQREPARVEVAPAGTSAAGIVQELCYVPQGGKVDLLRRILESQSGTALVFTRTKHGAARLRKQLEVMGHPAAEIHANRSLGQRRQALDGFKGGRYRILVATDIAARGIDVQGIGVVVNFDLPMAPDDYIHRIGRTGRAGREGMAISFAAPDQVKDVRAIERLLKMSIPLSSLSEQAPVGWGSRGDGRDDGRTGGRSEWRPSGRSADGRGYGRGSTYGQQGQAQAQGQAPSRGRTPFRRPERRFLRDTVGAASSEATPAQTGAATGSSAYTADRTSNRTSGEGSSHDSVGHDSAVRTPEGFRTRSGQSRGNRWSRR